jgi:ACR3 family arsenite efflux pump ArsB
MDPLSRKPGFLQPAALVATVVAAAGSVGLLLHAGRRSPQHFVVFLMAAWVLSPFVALALLSLVIKRWPAFGQRAIHGVMLLVSVASLTAYSVAVLRPLTSKPPAFVFVLVPPVSLVLAVAILSTAWWLSRSART